MNSLIELSCDTALKEHFDKLSLINFWLSCRNEYSQLSEKAVRFLMLFVRHISVKLASRLWFSQKTSTGID
jgi:hypothetical protein